MAAIFAAARGDTGFVAPGYHYHSKEALTVDRVADGKAVSNLYACREDVFYFADVDDGATWVSNNGGIVSLWWNGSIGDTDAVVATCTNAATGEVTFDTNTGSNRKGWLLVKYLPSAGSATGASGTISPVTQGTAGFVPPGSHFHSREAVDVDRVSDGTVLPNRLGLKESIFYFAAVSDGDTWQFGTTQAVSLAKSVQVHSCWWGGSRGGTATPDSVTATVTTTSSSDITFETAGASNRRGWLLVKYYS